MALKFCPKCNKILSHKKELIEKNKILNQKIILECKNPECRYEEKAIEGENLTTSQKIPEQKEKGRGHIEDEDIFATHEFLCKKCGNNKAQIIDRGIGYSDEDNLILLKCSKCGFSQRNTKKAS
jgi:DNA-directed RNA polymerase subunit M/transcription elongation factor TFIIS